jgi:hypothetical protein
MPWIMSEHRSYDLYTDGWILIHAALRFSVALSFSIQRMASRHKTASISLRKNPKCPTFFFNTSSGVKCQCSTSDSCKNAADREPHRVAQVYHLKS